MPICPVYLASSDRAILPFPFGDAWSGVFGATVEQPSGIYGRFGLWGRDEDETSSTFRELLILVQTVEEEAPDI